MTERRFAAAVMLAVIQAVAMPAPTAVAAELRLNDVQVLGSHNSYKLAMRRLPALVLGWRRPEIARTLEYEHVPLGEQLDLGVRALELDVFDDPTSELFGRGNRFPVLHVQTIDDRSSCATLTECLAVIAAWSKAHPDHVPLVVTMNAKDAPIEWPGAVIPRPFDASSWGALDAVVRAALGARLINPAEVITSSGPVWPTLAASRGRILVVLDEGGAKLEAYGDGHETRALFGNYPEGHPGAAVMIVNEPVAAFERIGALVRAGYLVRTRADADTVEARSGETARRERAFASGAQIVSTDYYHGADPFGTGYVVNLPGGGAARCNPVRVAGGCAL
jgi:hypothetical protein